ncbi:MAG TPA: hypothetical protein PKD85_19960, partial [Saprospiraceae bacterium]|nr:hypothetical protein [Saprospiraceae bacterium]
NLKNSILPVPLSFIPNKCHPLGFMSISMAVKIKGKSERTFKVWNEEKKGLELKNWYKRGFLLGLKFKFRESLKWEDVFDDYKKKFKDLKLHYVLDSRFSSEKLAYHIAKTDTVTMSMKKVGCIYSVLSSVSGV